MCFYSKLVIFQEKTCEMLDSHILGYLMSFNQIFKNIFMKMIFFFYILLFNENFKRKSNINKIIKKFIYVFRLFILYVDGLK